MKTPTMETLKHKKLNKMRRWTHILCSQYCENHHTARSHLAIQCNSHQNLGDFGRRSFLWFWELEIRETWVQLTPS